MQFIDNLKELTDRPVDHIIVASLVADKQALLAQLVPYVTVQQISDALWQWAEVYFQLPLLP